MKFGKTKALNRWSTLPWLKPSFRKDLNTNRHLFALINLARTCSLYLQFSWNVTPKMGFVHCGMLLTCTISWIKPFLRKIISLHFDGLQIILFSLDKIKNRSTKSSKNFEEHTSTSCSRRLFVCLIWRGPLASSHKGSLIHDEKSARKNQTRSFSEDMWKRHFVEGSDWWNNIFPLKSSAISWDEFP